MCGFFQKNRKRRRLMRRCDKFLISVMVICCILLAGCSGYGGTVSHVTHPTTSSRNTASYRQKGTISRNVPSAEDAMVHQTPSNPPSLSSALETADDGAVHSTSYSARTPYSPTVLMYHLVEEKPFTSLTNLFLRPSEFEDQLKALNKTGYEYLFADEFGYSSRKCVMLTFDDGYEDNYTNMFPLLKKYHVKATIFMIAGSVGRSGYLTADMLREMSASGLVRIESHTVSHTDLCSLSDKTLNRECSDSQKILSQITGQPVRAICYPSGGVNEHVAAVAARYFSFGYTTKSAVHTKGCNLMEIPRLRIFRGESGHTLVAALK